MGAVTAEAAGESKMIAPWNLLVRLDLNSGLFGLPVD
jgi:hypothetical protein